MASRDPLESLIATAKTTRPSRDHGRLRYNRRLSPLSAANCVLVPYRTGITASPSRNRRPDAGHYRRRPRRCALNPSSAGETAGRCPAGLRPGLTHAFGWTTSLDRQDVPRRPLRPARGHPAQRMNCAGRCTAGRWAARPCWSRCAAGCRSAGTAVPNDESTRSSSTRATCCPVALSRADRASAGCHAGGRLRWMHAGPGRLARGADPGPRSGARRGRDFPVVGHGLGTDRIWLIAKGQVSRHRDPDALWRAGLLTRTMPLFQGREARQYHSSRIPGRVLHAAGPDPAEDRTDAQSQWTFDGRYQSTGTGTATGKPATTIAEGNSA